jgi:DNA-binding CsgD family transcriptional regulator
VTSPALQLDFVEAAYQWALADETWLCAVIVAAARAFGEVPFAFGFFYDASDPAAFRFSEPLLVAACPALSGEITGALCRHSPAMVAVYRNVPVGYARPSGLVDRRTAELLEQSAAADVFFLNAVDDGGRGCFVGLGAQDTVLGPPAASVFWRLAAHLASAHRCRRRLRELQPAPQRENDGPPGLELLTGRERQVVMKAAADKSTKEIAYDLGISPSTTRVLIGRACLRLGVRTRQQLLELPAIKAIGNDRVLLVHDRMNVVPIDQHRPMATRTR